MNGGGGPNYWPNSFGGPAPDPSALEPHLDVSVFYKADPEYGTRVAEGLKLAQPGGSP